MYKVYTSDCIQIQKQKKMNLFLENPVLQITLIITKSVIRQKPIMIQEIMLNNLRKVNYVCK